MVDDLLPFAHSVLTLLAKLAGRARRSVRTTTLAGLLGASERTVRDYLHKLELRGLVARRSPKTGWFPV